MTNQNLLPSKEELCMMSDYKGGTGVHEFVPSIHEGYDECKWCHIYRERESTPTQNSGDAGLGQAIGFLRQWLNEDRITDPKRLVTNEDIEHWLMPAIQAYADRARLDELGMIDSFTDRLDDDYGEFECLDDIEKHIALRKAQLSYKQGGGKNE